MEPDLLGYVLNALDPQERADAEAYLCACPEAQSQVENLRQALEPLAWDACETAPPGLAERTLAHIASHGPRQPRTSTGLGGLPWRRIIEVAALLVFTVTSIGAALSWIGGLRVQHPSSGPNAVHVVACKNNLHELFVQLQSYSDTHSGRLPDVATAMDPPRNVGGLVFAILHDKHPLSTDIKAACPALPGPSPLPVGVADVKAMSDAAYRQWVGSLQNSYAYSIGYRQGDQLVGLRLDDTKPSSLMPLMADNSPIDPLGAGQSANHGGCGQNVLYCDGHITFCHSRFAGYNLDDIYLSRDKKVAAGVDWSDSVLTICAYPQ